MPDDNGGHPLPPEWEQRQQDLERKLRELEAGVQPILELGNVLGNLAHALGGFTPQPVKLKPDDRAQEVLPSFETVDEVPRLPHYVNVEWRTYAGFRRNMQRREQAQRDAQAANGRVQEITKELLANQQGGDSVRNISRVMEHYGLDPKRDWPPSAWPEEQPAPRARKRIRRRDLHSLVAAALLPALPLLLDVVSDGRLNHVINALALAGCGYGHVKL